MAKVAVVKPAVSSSLEVLTQDYLASCRARGLAPSTIRTVYSYALDSVLLPWCATHKIESLEQLDQRALDRFTSDLLEIPGKRGQLLSRHTVHQYVRVIRQFLKWCRKEGEDVHGNPQLPRLPQPIIDVLTREEIDQLETAVPTERDKLIIRLLADTGIRVGELCGLEGDDIITAQDRRSFLKIRGKGSKERLVPLTPPLIRRIDRYRRARPDDARSQRVFLAARKDRYGEYAPLTRSGVLQLLRHAADRAGITRRVNPHLFRHSFATEALRRGMNPVQLAQLLGHSGLRMIEQVYAHLNAADGYEAVMRMLTAER
jgi:site-specific recombinase XerD